MPTCQICHNKWSWIQTIKKTSTLNPAMTCPHCDKTQYQTQKSKGKMGILTLIVLLPLVIQLFFDIPGTIIFSLFPILFILVLILYPFIVKLSSQETYIGEE
ncbi:hypothetical protein CSV69_04395 [Sporosarcina sp. P26b]|uniref:TIGR04104 family putative zinc finger protein n=1 Tax=Sporosarcina sp. P26b TaxID=2048253 RepID=UPI000C171A4D|nr:TIGR04104 family putative zinc finger protein [Sporosarcina sp. P26b]PIC96767.1 hypothetical protein CSV69_04395 [Sporosarcina sp. P26b]